MDVILVKDIDRLGKAGENVSVKDGYARNFLVPKGLGLPATAANRARIESLLASKKIHAQSQIQKAQELAQRLAGLLCTLAVPVGDQEKLHGAVTAADIVGWLAESGVALKKHELDLPAPITKLGEYEVSIKLHPEVSARLRVSVIRKS